MRLTIVYLFLQICDNFKFNISKVVRQFCGKFSFVSATFSIFNSESRIRFHEVTAISSPVSFLLKQSVCGRFLVGPIPP